MNKQLTLGSLFDGIGGFPLAGIYAGMKPLWASEIEPFPIRVITKRLPDMQHLGNVCKLTGADIPAVDVVTFGSPCQNLSIAGKRAGLEGEQSSLFFEAVRVIREMREATNEQYPRWAVWENVPGALSSAEGRDFCEVLWQLLSICEREADVPMPQNGKWLPAGEIMGDTCSLAWRVIDAAQGWGVAQRRKRVFVVLDLTGGRAGKVLFESEGVSGYSPPRPEAGQGTAQGTPGRIGASGEYVLNDQGGERMDVSCEQANTLRANSEGHAPAVLSCGFCTEHSANSRGIGYEKERAPTLRAGVVPGCAIEYNPTDSRIKVKEDSICQTLTARCGTGGNTVPLTMASPVAYGISSDQSNAMLSDNPHAGIYEAETSRTLDCNGGNPCCNQGGVAVVESYALQGNMIGRKDCNGPQGCGVNKEVAYTLNTIDQQAVCAVCNEKPVAFAQNQRDEVRDLGEQSGTLSAQQGIHQQTFVAAPVYSVRPTVGTEVDEEKTAPIRARDFKDPPIVGTPAYCMTIGAYGHVAEEKTPTLEARGYKDPPVVGRPETDVPVRRTTASGKEVFGTLEASMASKQWLGNQEAFSGDYHVLQPDYKVRRLTPLECCRLQGYPDGWTQNLGTEEPTEREIAWWAGVFEAWNAAQGKKNTATRNRIVKWLKDPQSDAAEYKAYGNSVAVPCVFFVLAGIMWAEEQ